MNAHTRAEYYALVAELTAIEQAHRLRPHGAPAYLTDESVDQENIDLPEGHPDFWAEMYRAACMAAGQRAEEYGLDINALLGRVIY